MTAKINAPFVLERCPHCGSDAQVEPHGVYRFKCRACGRPRLPMDAQNPTPTEVTTLLRAAHGARIRHYGFKIAGYGLLLLAVCSAIFGLTMGWLLGAGLLGYGVLAGLTLLPVLLSLLLFGSARNNAENSAAQLEQAWTEAASWLYRAHGGQLSAEDLARATGMSADEATVRLAEAEVTAFLSSDHPTTPRFRVNSTTTDPLRDEAERELREALGEDETETFKARR